MTCVEVEVRGSLQPVTFTLVDRFSLALSLMFVLLLFAVAGFLLTHAPLHR
jgi:hypothetical protein